MNFYQEINTSKDILVTELFEPEQNALQFTLTIGKTATTPHEVIIAGKSLSPVFRISFDDDNDHYSVYFDSYICYNVLNESYEQLGGKAFNGKKIRIYSDSNFLNYVKADTIASSDYPGEFKHYAFITLNHIINVASEHEPIIKKLL